jgi:hypothetical protein
MTILSMKKSMMMTMAAFALTTVSAFAEPGCASVVTDQEIQRAVSSQASAEQQKQEPKHRSLLNKEIREPRDSNHY